jgi:hypothetical protein
MWFDAPAQHAGSFLTLLSSSAKLLHQIDDINWKALALESAAPPETKPAPQDNVQDSEEESEDDDDLFGMLGGYESSDDEKVVSDDVKVDVLEDDNDQEDEATLLKRASAVHNALLLSLDLGNTVEELDFSALVEAITVGTGDRIRNVVADTSDELTLMLSYTLSPSTFDNCPKIVRCSPERWNKVCSTNALLAIQFLMHLQSNDVLNDWNGIVLPLLLGNSDVAQVSLLMKNDELREAVLNLTPSAVQSKEGLTDQITTTCNICIKAIKNATFVLDVIARQKKISVVSSVLIHLFDRIPKLVKGSGVDVASMEELVKNALHHAVLIILRGICYETVHSESNANEDRVQPPLLSVEALRVITGMLLLKLYPPSSIIETPAKSKLSNAVADERAMQLWNEILMLLSPHSTDVVAVYEYGKSTMRRCKHW